LGQEFDANDSIVPKFSPSTRQCECGRPCTGTDDLLPTITDTGSSDLSRSPNAATKKGKQGKPARRRMSSLASFLAQEEVDKQAAADLEKTSRKISSDEARMNEWLADVSVSVHMIQVWTFVSILWSCRQR
jgi:hypothetical protein